jgi:hypothetical protein
VSVSLPTNAGLVLGDYATRKSSEVVLRSPDWPRTVRFQQHRDMRPRRGKCMQCANCNTTNPPQAKYCLGCARAIPPVTAIAAPTAVSNRQVQLCFLPTFIAKGIPLNIVAKCLVICVVAFTTAGRAQTLRELKTKYLNEKVFVVPEYSDKDGTVVGFDAISGKAARGNCPCRLSATYLNSIATVTNVRFLRTVFDSPRPKDKDAKNAMGEVILDDDLELSGRFIEVVLQFEDGSVATHSEKYSKVLADLTGKRAAFRNIQMAAVRQKHAKAFADGQASLTGKTLYIAGYDWAFDSATTLEDILSSRAITLRLRDKEVPALTPVEVIAAKYVEPYDTVILKLRLLTGRDIVYAARYREEDANQLKSDLGVTDDSLLGRVSGRLLTAIPSQLTAEEVEAIQNGEIFKGMSEIGLVYLKGRTSTINSYGDGGFQLVYAPSLIVYLDSQKKVTSWQTMAP